MLTRIDTPLAIFWFRRDLRIDDNAAFAAALSSGRPVQALFIFDDDILDTLESRQDARVDFIHQTLLHLDQKLREVGGSLLVMKGRVEIVWKKLLKVWNIEAVYAARDYEPYAIERDRKVKELLARKRVAFHCVKDQVVFEPGEVLKESGDPYVVYTPFSRKWKAQLQASHLKAHPSGKRLKAVFPWSGGRVPSLKSIGFEKTDCDFPSARLDRKKILRYADDRDCPARNGTTRLGLHLRFGTVSIRKCVSAGLELSEVWLNELIWREFFMHILFHFPHVVERSFRPEYDAIRWRNDETEFQSWCEGRTGVPMVDAGMRELNAIGFMHNRVRMISASYLVKHLLIDWRWGEAYFASKLLDYELASNNGNWQWVAGTGCDAAPYFRIFNPEAQAKKFDPQGVYIRRWVPEVGSARYPEPLVEPSFARQRALRAYKDALKRPRD